VRTFERVNFGHFRFFGSWNLRLAFLIRDIIGDGQTVDITERHSDVFSLSTGETAGKVRVSEESSCEEGPGMKVRSGVLPAGKRIERTYHLVAIRDHHIERSFS
jgi:hypothetical protein